ncbi:cytochrome c/c1 heme lyase-domain-containing protein [Tuber borchii]|uniref:Holocytochrome c-type synthase n=1 Tax=Tuber borchii TaxID=42251 RepID=A0A2T6ZZ41_TUBBO|nr:cytochrome c/c1 heme lyase-domain-containing protein [Tuber borchii]
MEPSNPEDDPRYQIPRSGNWIYPSGELFFNGMKSNNWVLRAEDLRAIVPIHTAVNERAWKEIKQ